MKEGYKPVSILLVEDDDIDAKTVERGFRKLRLANPVHRAKNGMDALSKLRCEDRTQAIKRPYIILLDLNMPVMNGLEFLQTLRHDQRLSDSVVFVLTTSSADEDRVAAYRENVAGYIVKSDVSSGFNEVVNMLDQYWSLVLLPQEKRVNN